MENLLRRTRKSKLRWLEPVNRMSEEKLPKQMKNGNGQKAKRRQKMLFLVEEVDQELNKTDSNAGAGQEQEVKSTSTLSIQGTEKNI